MHWDRKGKAKLCNMCDIHNSFPLLSVHCMYYTNDFRRFAVDSDQKKSKFNHLPIELALASKGG